MAAFRFNIQALNEICVQLGGQGSHAREVAALNEICHRVGGAGGHARTLAALNEWSARVGGAGGHARSLAAANAISVRLGGAGGHARTLDALAAIRARLAVADSITSGSVRSQMMVGQAGTYAGGERATQRQRDRSNVAIARPWFEFFHGRILSTGVIDVELETTLSGGTACNYRCALLTGIAGTAKNQSAATLTRATFFGMLQDGGFVAAGGAVSPDGYTVTVPNGIRFRSDRFEVSLAAGQEYFIQTECVAANGSVAPNPRGRYCIPALGDLSYNEPAASAANTVFAKDWTPVWNATASSAFGPIAVLGTGSAPVVIVDGDSVICDVARPGTGANGSDSGDAIGVKAFAKRALNAHGYAFIDVSVPGTNVGNFMAGHGLNGIRAGLMQYGAAAITDHLHNDRRSGVAFEATGGWSESNRATWNATGLRKRYEWHNDWLRSRLKSGARIVRCTLAPYTNSTDAWATTAGQTGKNDDSRLVGGLCHRHERRPVQARRPDPAPRPLRRHRLRHPRPARRRLRPLRRPRRHADGKWPAGGVTADGTHPGEALQIAAAATLGPLLPGLLGF